MITHRCKTTKRLSGKRWSCSSGRVWVGQLFNNTSVEKKCVLFCQHGAYEKRKTHIWWDCLVTSALFHNQGIVTPLRYHLPTDWIRFNLLSLHRVQVHMQQNVFSAFNPSLVITEQWAAVMRPGSNWGFSDLLKDLQLMGRAGIEPTTLGLQDDPLTPLSYSHWSECVNQTQILRQIILISTHLQPSPAPQMPNDSGSINIWICQDVFYTRLVSTCIKLQCFLSRSQTYIASLCRFKPNFSSHWTPVLCIGFSLKFQQLAESLSIIQIKVLLQTVLPSLVNPLLLFYDTFCVRALLFLPSAIRWVFDPRFCGWSQPRPQRKQRPSHPKDWHKYPLPSLVSLWTQ